MFEERQSAIQTYEAIGRAAAEPGPGPTPLGPAIQGRVTVSHGSFEEQASGAELARRVAVLVFGLIQAVVVLRIVFRLVDAREGNALVAGIFKLSQIFVAPFDGILHTNALSAGGSVLDLAALVAIVGWTLIGFAAFAVLDLFRRETAYSGSAG